MVSVFMKNCAEYIMIIYVKYICTIFTSSNLFQNIVQFQILILSIKTKMQAVISAVNYQGNALTLYLSFITL